MMKVSDGKIGTREFTSIILFTVGIKFSDTTPDILLDKGQNAAWIIPVFSYFIIFIPLLILLGLLKKHNKGLVELIYGLAGKYFGFVLGFLLFFIMLSGMIVNVRSYMDIVNTMYYQKTPVPYLLLMLLAVCFFVANRGFETIGRTAWIIIPYIQIFVVLLIILVWQEADIMHLFPIAGPGLNQLVKVSASHSSIFGEMILLAAFFPYVRAYKDFRFASICGFGFACLQIAFYTAIYVFVFDYPAVRDLVYPFHQLTRAASIGQIITNAEAIFLGFWVISTVIHFSITLYLIVSLFAKTLHMNEFEQLLLPFTGLIFMVALIPPNVFVANILREQVLKASSVILLSLPFLLWGLDRWKGRTKHEGT